MRQFGLLGGDWLFPFIVCEGVYEKTRAREGADGFTWHATQRMKLAKFFSLYKRAHNLREFAPAAAIASSP